MEPKLLGIRLRQAREQARLSQEELAAAVGKDQRAISEYENGQRRLAATDLPAFAQILNVPILSFFTEDSLSETLDQVLLSEFHRLPTTEDQQSAIEVVRTLADMLQRNQP